MLQVLPHFHSNHRRRDISPADLITVEFAIVLSRRPQTALMDYTGVEGREGVRKADRPADEGGRELGRKGGWCRDGAIEVVSIGKEVERKVGTAEE